MTGLGALFRPRHVEARARATCSDVSLDISIDYTPPPPDPRTDMQRRIDSLMSASTPGWTVKAGGVEFWFEDGVRLTHINLYENFAAAASVDLPPAKHAPSAWIKLPDFGLASGDRFSMAADTRVLIDRRHRTVRLSLSRLDAVLIFALAEGLLVRADERQCMVDLTAYDVEWADSAPVP
jgi:hypothetical protein